MDPIQAQTLAQMKMKQNNSKLITIQIKMRVVRTQTQTNLMQPKMRLQNRRAVKMMMRMISR